MPRRTNSTPSYRHHRASGQAVVTLAGNDHYLGPWQSRNSRREYDRLICIGPKAQDVIRPYLLRDESDDSFSPTESKQRRRQVMHKQRTMPLSRGNKPGSYR